MIVRDGLFNLAHFQLFHGGTAPAMFGFLRLILREGREDMQ